MRIAVIPFSTAEGVPPALGRQLANFVMERLRHESDSEVMGLVMLTEAPGQPGKKTYMNLGGEFMEPEQIKQVHEQTELDLLIDGLIKNDSQEQSTTVLRFHHGNRMQEPKVEEMPVGKDDLFDMLRWIDRRVFEEAGLQARTEEVEFGTNDPKVALKFLLGLDAVTYLQQAEGDVVKEFDPWPPLKMLIEAVAADPNYESPYVTALEMTRLCAMYRVGKFVQLAEALKKLTEIKPADYRAWYALAEIHMLINEPGTAADYYEKAIEIEPNESAIYTRLGIAMERAGMPVNAERNFKKAIALEGPDKPSLDFLANVLTENARAHEVPPLWKEMVDADPKNARAHAKYALALIAAGHAEDGEKAFEAGIEQVEDATILKRHFAPVLAQRGEVDRAMDFYEDVLDADPTDVAVLLEYAQTLHLGDRDFEIPQVLRNALALNPDANIKANANAWLIELEQPKRIEVVEAANKKIEAGDFEGAIRDLKPMRNWLADYWKLWAMLAAAYNRTDQPEQAEEAATRLVNLFPAFEPAYAELMQALTKQEKHGEAYRAMRYGAMNVPNSLGLHLNLGLAAKRAGHEEEARAVAAQIREAVGANPQIEPALVEMEA